MIKIMMTAVALSALVSLSATAAPQKMTSVQLDQVVAGTTDCDKGNNGWGNGADPTNAGSGSGGTADSKIGYPAGTGGNLASADKINTNPTTSTGR